MSTVNWKACALAGNDDWAEAFDDITGELVVYSDSRGVHYTGADAWQKAALHDDAPGVQS